MAANACILCSRPGCNRFAVLPPKGYDQNVPVCDIHIERWDSLFYAEEIRKLWDDPKQCKYTKCIFCGFFSLRGNTAKMPCCGAYSCCFCRCCCKCGSVLELPEKEQGHDKKYYPVRWFVPWEFIEEVSCDSPTSEHHGHLDVYKAAYEKMIEKGMKIAEGIERVKANLAQYKIGIDSDLFRDTVRKDKEDFDTLYRCYQDLFIQLGVNPKITPAFVPTVVHAAFSSFSSGDSSKTTSQ